MIFNLKRIYSISHLSYSPNTIPFIQKYQETSQHGSFKLLSFNNAGKNPPLLHRLFKSKPHAELFELYLNFIKLGQEGPKDIAYRSIQGNLRNKIMSEIRKKQIKITVQKCQILQSTRLQQKQFRGVFIHRNLNLSNNSYDIKVNRNGSISFDLKKSFGVESIIEYQKILRTYKSEKLQDIYCQTFDQFQKNKEIKRYLYRIITDLVIKIDQKGNKVILGSRGPTQHLLQIESVFNRNYQMEQFFLTDVDFILNGNYFLRNKFY